jgi:hypothetical protein
LRTETPPLVRISRYLGIDKQCRRGGALRVSMLMAVALGWALLVLGLAVLAFLIARHNR